MSCKIILVIHALTQWNVDKRKQGHTDTPLNDEGQRMAHALAERFQKNDILAIYASDLRRAYDTAKPTAEKLGLSVQPDYRLREGRWKDQERESEYPVLPFAVESETNSDVLERVIDALAEIAQNMMEKQCL